MVLSKANWLMGSGIQIFEDLTPLNSEILACTRKKLPDKIEDSWFNNGIIYTKLKSNGAVEKLPYKNYQTWLDLPWPK